MWSTPRGRNAALWLILAVVIYLLSPDNAVWFVGSIIAGTIGVGQGFMAFAEVHGESPDP